MSQSDSAALIGHFADRSFRSLVDPITLSHPLYANHFLRKRAVGSFQDSPNLRPCRSISLIFVVRQTSVNNHGIRLTGASTQ